MQVSFLWFNWLLEVTLILIKALGSCESSLLLRVHHLVGVISCLSHWLLSHRRKHLVIIEVSMTLPSYLQWVLLQHWRGIVSLNRELSTHCWWMQTSNAWVTHFQASHWVLASWVCTEYDLRVWVEEYLFNHERQTWQRLNPLLIGDQPLFALK